MIDSKNRSNYLQIMKTLNDLAYAWVNWDQQEFVDMFFKPRFGITSETDDPYLKEKWRKFQKNPVSYIQSMDSMTLEAFARGIEDRRLGRRK